MGNEIMDRVSDKVVLEGKIKLKCMYEHKGMWV